MALKTDVFEAHTIWTIGPEDTHVALTKEATTDLLSILSSAEDYMYLAVQDTRKYEVVKVQNVGGVLQWTRGLDGTKAVRFAAGACISGISPLSVRIMKELICSYDCCEEGDCQCEAVQIAGVSAPDGYVGTFWHGAVTFSGTQPMSVTVNSTPSWMTATVQGNLIVVEGTPSVAGIQYFSVAASNCNGTAIVTKAIPVNIKREV